MDNEISVISTPQSSIGNEACSFDMQYLYDVLMHRLKGSLSEVQNSEIPLQHIVNANQSEVKRLVEIMKEKKLVVEELLNILSATEAKDYPVNILHSHLRMIRGLTTDYEETLELAKSDRRKIEKAIKTAEEENQTAELLVAVTNKVDENTAEDKDYRRIINQNFVESRQNMSYVLDKLFPNDHEEMKNILHLLCKASDNPDDSYISTEDCSEMHMEFLFNCCLVETDPNDPHRIKFVKTYS